MNAEKPDLNKTAAQAGQLPAEAVPPVSTRAVSGVANTSRIPPVKTSAALHAIARMEPAPVFPSESGANAAAPVVDFVTPLGQLLAGHVLRDGELVLLILRPSRWFILLSSLKFLAATATFMALAAIYDDFLRHLSRQYLQVGLFLIIGRLMWATLQWMGRLYLLTDMRIVTIKGVFTLEIFDCPLRKVARTLLERTFKEQICRIGSIVIVPQDEQVPFGSWRMVAKPRRVHEFIKATIARAKQGGAMR
ncbi:MAG: hypothetical protein ACHRHE_24910 [Tepidisphaerales bacterium]